MKILSILIALVLVQTSGKTQSVYRSALANSPDTKVEITQGSSTMYIVGHASGEIVIETDYTQKAAATSGLQKIDAPEPAKNADRAKGLKPVSSAGVANTNVGLNVQKSNGVFRITGIIPDAANNTYTISIPDRASLTMTEINLSAQSAIEITKLKGEVNLTMLNTQVKMEKVEGPVVLQTTNGNVEIVYDKLTPGKPNSITSVNGFVDVTLPKSAALNITLNSINGDAFTDFDIEVAKNNAPAMVPQLQMTMMEGTINRGGVPFTISTVNGDIYLRKGK
jgi:hypothetical protein